MATPKDSLNKTLIVALIMCVVFSIIVASAAVILKPMQDANKVLDRNKNVLAAAGLLKDGMSAADINKQFSRFQTKLVDLSSGEYVTDAEMKNLGIASASSFDQKAAAASGDPKLATKLDPAIDVALLKTQSKYAPVYLLDDSAGNIETAVLPVRGYGLWSMMYGFIALQGDADTIRGFGFYSHAETPGLGGEVDNPSWKALWPGVKLFDDNDKLAIDVTSKKKGPHVIDGLSGATLTTRGVDHLVRYWMGQYGFGPYLANLQAGK